MKERNGITNVSLGETDKVESFLLFHDIDLNRIFIFVLSIVTTVNNHALPVYKIGMVLLHCL